MKIFYLILFLSASTVYAQTESSPAESSPPESSPPESSPPESSTPQSSAPRSEEIPMDDIEGDEPEVAEETEVEPVTPIKSKPKRPALGKARLALGKDVDGTRALDRGEFDAQTLSVSHYKRNGVSLEVDPD